MIDKMIVQLSQKEIDIVSGAISKKIIDLTDVATGSALFGLTILFAPVEVVGVGGAVLISFGAGCVGYWVVPTVSSYLIKTPKEIA